MDNGDIVYLRGLFPWQDSIGIVQNTFAPHRKNGTTLVYECTSQPRPPCFRTGRIDPKGIQAQKLEQYLTSKRPAYHYTLRTPMFYDEEDRLLGWLENALGDSYDVLSVPKKGVSVLRFAQDLIGPSNLDLIYGPQFVAKALTLTDHWRCPATKVWTPRSLLRYGVRHGFLEYVGRLNAS